MRMASSERSARFPRILLAAPHRLAFLVGTLNVIALALWWLAQMAGLHLIPLNLPSGNLPPTLLHGPAMLYLLLPPFIFGFLMTVFPRWMGYPDLAAGQYGPVAVLLATGSLLAHSGLWLGIDAILMSGFTVFGTGWALALLVLGRLIRQNASDAKSICWHAVSALAALTLGLIGLLAALAFFVTASAEVLKIANRIGITLFLLPVFLTVCHRMVPFFAGSVVKDYVRWRPDWLIGALWILLAAKFAADLGGWLAFDLLASTALAALSGFMAWKWWPRGSAPGLFKVLIWGFVWAPVGFSLSAFKALGFNLGRAPDHALMIGFSCSLLIAMVTRVTHGHSGRPLEMSAAAWIAFFSIQIAAFLRVSAAIADEHGFLLISAAGAFIVGPLPWLLRHAKIYGTPRLDGKPG